MKNFTRDTFLSYRKSVEQNKMEKKGKARILFGLQAIFSTRDSRTWMEQQNWSNLVAGSLGSLLNLESVMENMNNLLNLELSVDNMNSMDSHGWHG